MIIAVDFEGTCVSKDYPKMGKTIKGAPSTLRKLAKKRHKIILYTLRSHLDRNKETSEVIKSDTLQEAINWFKERNIPLYAVNENPDQKRWTSSSKLSADIYIDDKSLGVPLKLQDSKLCVDWKKVRKLLKQRHLL